MVTATTRGPVSKAADSTTNRGIPRSPGSPTGLARPSKQDQSPSRAASPRSIVSDLPPGLVPQHVAITVDGNGRWANRHELTRTNGHQAAIPPMYVVINTAIDAGVQHLSLYLFSTENWKRDPREVAVILEIIENSINDYMPLFESRQVRLVWSGRPLEGRPSLTKTLLSWQERTAQCAGMTLNLCINYGGHQEIVHASRRIAEQVSSGLLKPQDIDEQTLTRNLYQPDLPPVDLLIRTSGEQRISNLLLWQSAYAELMFPQELWPDFGQSGLLRAFETYAKRERRFGGAVDQHALESATVPASGEIPAQRLEPQEGGAGGERVRPNGKRVAVLGGGVAGLSAALELVERGYAVTVYERHELGGKARSIPAPGSGLPGEHGFRFFPGFYQNLTATMRRIPFPGNRNGTWDNLVPATAYLGSWANGLADTLIPFRPTSPLPPGVYSFTPETVTALITQASTTLAHLPKEEALFGAQMFVTYWSSCEERRLGQWDKVSWNDFLCADRMSTQFQRGFADGMLRNLAAMKSKEASTHSVGLVSEATIWSVLGRGNEPGGTVDRVLNGSSSEKLIDPWVAHLKTLGVTFEVGWTAESLTVEQDEITCAVVRDRNGNEHRVRADHFVCAMPVERLTALLSAEVLAADPDLTGCTRLRTDWMNGLMFYLKEELPLAHGHVNYLDSPWAITSISQAQFWERPFSEYHDHTVKDCLSSIISDWFAPGTFNRKAAKDCTPQEIAKETWEQIKAHLNSGGREVLHDDMLHSWFLDPAIISPGTPGVTNDSPLFIQSPGSWDDRPHSRTKIRNLFLAGDWVRTNINVTTMEGANEGGRQAVNALLDADNSTQPRCSLGELHIAPEFDALKDIDRDRYLNGLPNLFDPQELAPNTAPTSRAKPKTAAVSPPS
ncbi:polyprenyl diphosphate synthase [Streptomyces exfoliatus]|uniref:polyprenyl diphosphate synthase n=1 Tax=Streptomyces exfoliatus TaxID=1905 RepID=UPI003C3078EF